MEILSRSEEGECVFNAETESVNQEDPSRHLSPAKATDDDLPYSLITLTIEYVVRGVTLIYRRARRQFEFQRSCNPPQGKSALPRWLLSRSFRFALGAMFCKLLSTFIHWYWL
ncbi:MAG: hypothetical protein MOB07_06520 [Acidobacteria bacterium]|nr:hypothetical protein [Acidobacteriota bacterium]